MMRPQFRSVFLRCAAALVFLGALAAPSVRAQGVMDPVIAVEQARDDYDYARKREADLSAAIAAQEKANAKLREELTKSGRMNEGQNRDLVKGSEDVAALRKKLADVRQRRDTAREKLDEA